MSKAKPGNLSEILKNCNNFSELPDPDPLPEREIFLHQCPPSSKTLPKRDIEAQRYEERLRFQYGCSEAMPAGFDPEKLEARFRPNAGNSELTTANVEHHLEDDELSELGDYSEYEHILNIISSEEGDDPFETLSDISVTESLDSDEQLDEYEHEAIINVALAEKFTRVSCEAGPVTTEVRRSAPEPIIRKPTPRIRIGSKPPLSRSAFARAGLPSLKDGSAAATTLRGYPKAPQYFPFKSKARRN
ncbi:hypothetical protein F4805DRAFT_50285 [Annulohypoxylon moriforme]|nr:hypothetical protein F4805DRAFT_50285 [Annulohypoxylon moriforme]